MQTRHCPNCYSERFHHHEYTHYDPGFTYSCEKCNHDFDTPATVGSDEDLPEFNDHYEEVI